MTIYMGQKRRHTATRHALMNRWVFKQQCGAR